MENVSLNLSLKNGKNHNLDSSRGEGAVAKSVGVVVGVDRTSVSASMYCME